MFLCHINDLSDSVKSQVRLFADDCLIYRQIKPQKDHQILQNDLKELEIWAAKWGMRFNTKKCYILSIRQKSSHFYQLNGEILQQVDSNPYLGLTISEDLQWKTHSFFLSLNTATRPRGHSRQVGAAFVSIRQKKLKYSKE